MLLLATSISLVSVDDRGCLIKVSLRERRLAASLFLLHVLLLRRLLVNLLIMEHRSCVCGWNGDKRLMVVVPAARVVL